MKKTSEEIKAWLREQASKGGSKTVELYGKKYMSELVKRRWDKARKNKAIDKTE